MEDEYVFNEIRSFKLQLSSLQNSMREIKNSMTFMGNNLRELNLKSKNFKEKDQSKQTQKASLEEEVKEVEKSNESYTLKVDNLIKEVNYIKKNFYKKYDLENTLHNDTYLLKELKNANFELEKKRKELESKRLLHQKENQHLNDRMKINEDKRNEAQINDEDIQKKIDDCLYKKKENYSKSDAMKVT